MNRSWMMRLSVVLMAFLSITGCHQWQSNHSNCVEVGETHYTPSETRTKVPEYTPRMTSKAYIPSSQFTLAQLAYQSMVPEASAGGIMITTPILVEASLQYGIEVMMWEKYILEGEALALEAEALTAAGRTAEASIKMSRAQTLGERALYHSQRAKYLGQWMAEYIAMFSAAGETIIGSVLMNVSPPIDILMQGPDGYDPGMYYDDQASMNRGYDHMQGAGILDGWIANRSSKRGSGGGDSDAGHVCEYDNFFMPPGDPDEDDPCNAHRTTGLFPETETPVGTVMLQSLANNSHWVNVIQSMQRQQLEFGMGELLIYDYDLQTSSEMASWHMDFPFIKALALVYPNGYSAHYYEDPISGEQVFAFGMEINGQFVDIETGDYYGEMFPGQDMFTVYSAENVYGVNY